MIFANSKVPRRRFQVCLNEYKIFELPEDSNKMFQRNLVDRYIDRSYTTSSVGKFAVLDTLCFAEFSRYYYLPSNPKYKENDYQPEGSDDESVSGMSKIGYAYPKQIKLLSNKNSSAVKYHMFFNIMYQKKKPSQKNMHTTCFLCTIRLEMKKHF